MPRRKHLYLYAYINSISEGLQVNFQYKKSDFVGGKTIVMEYVSFRKMFIFVMNYPVITEIFGFKHFCINDANGPKNRSLFMIEYQEFIEFPFYYPY